MRPAIRIATHEKKDRGQRGWSGKKWNGEGDEDRFFRAVIHIDRIRPTDRGKDHAQSDKKKDDAACSGQN